MIYLNKIKQKHFQINTKRQSHKRSANQFLRLPDFSTLTDYFWRSRSLQIGIFLIISLVLTFGVMSINSSSLNTNANNLDTQIINNYTDTANGSSTSKSSGFQATLIK